MKEINYPDKIQAAKITIYDPILIGSDLYIPTEELEKILNAGLTGFSTESLPIRTRSKIVKSKICEILGYPISQAFIKTRPRFPGQNFDTYIQKSNNLQIWNEALSPTRRYVLIKEVNGIVTKVKVVTGKELSKLDTTGTLTQKYQARFNPNNSGCELVSKQDTSNLSPYIVNSDYDISFAMASPLSFPQKGKILKIEDIYQKLKSLVGFTFTDPGRDQERNRSAILHQTVCNTLGYKKYQDDGRFPDIKAQLLEIKLQTSQTIDLGLVTPSSIEPCELPQLDETYIRHCDIRYAVFDAKIENGKVIIIGVYLSTGEDFLKRFPQFGGKVLNKKIQIPLPSNFL